MNKVAIYARLSREDERDSATWDSFKRADKINKMYVGMTRAIMDLQLLVLQ